MLFFPDDETMKENKAFYLTLEGVTEEMFKPRPEALQYLQREEGEKALLNFIEKSFKFDEGEILEATNPAVVSQSADNEISST